MLFSIIIPAYNVDNYISICLKSIIYQTYKNYEIIIVDDGSCDLTGAICDTFSSKYSFVKVIHTKNFGVSYARNLALNIAKGDYIIFLDADDLLFDNALIKLKEIIEDTDADIFYSKRTDFIQLDGMNKTCYTANSSKIYESIRDFIKSNLFCGWQPSQYAIKNDFIKRNNIIFKMI